MRYVLIAALLGLTACAEDESACVGIEDLCSTCEDAEALVTCEALLKRRDQRDCSLARDEITLACGGGEAGVTPPFGDMGKLDATTPFTDMSVEPTDLR